MSVERWIFAQGELSSGKHFGSGLFKHIVSRTDIIPIVLLSDLRLYLALNSWLQPVLLWSRGTMHLKRFSIRDLYDFFFSGRGKVSSAGPCYVFEKRILCKIVVGALVYQYWAARSYYRTTE